MLNNNTLCVVDVEHLQIYDFANSKEQAEQKFFKALETCQEDIKTWESHCRTYPNAEQFKIYLEEEKNKQYKIMTYGEFLQMERDYYINLPLTEITEDKFFEMLYVLPPIKWKTIDNIEMFCMSEMLTGCYTSQYLHDRNANKFYHKIVDITDKKTWGYNFIFRITGIMSLMKK